MEGIRTEIGLTPSSELQCGARREIRWQRRWRQTNRVDVLRIVGRLLQLDQRKIMLFAATVVVIVRVNDHLIHLDVHRFIGAVVVVYLLDTVRIGLRVELTQAHFYPVKYT